MPTSMREGKSWIGPRISRHLPGVVLDLGAGEGTYANLLPRAGSTFVAVEIWEPYVSEFNLAQLYDRVIVGDVREVDFPDADVVILGDIVEHMDFEDAVFVWGKARRAARKAVFASLPLGHHPQGAVNGNEHETHRVDWSHRMVMESLPGVRDFQVGRVIGVYEASPE